jgi:hypothetical protein
VAAVLNITLVIRLYGNALFVVPVDGLRDCVLDEALPREGWRLFVRVARKAVEECLPDARVPTTELAVCDLEPGNGHLGPVREAARVWSRD